jgi:hypothetical protein
MAKSKPVGRAKRREQNRAALKLARARQRLFQLQAGGSPERPIEVESASLVEPRATAVRCPTCSGNVALEAHEAITVEGKRLRRAELRCRHCATSATLYFRLVQPALN